MSQAAKELISTRPLSTDWGLLLLRLGVGFSVLLFHGWGKLSGGPEGWEKIGGAMANLGITFAPTFWGFMAAFAEFACALLIVLGCFTRPAAALLGFTMLVAAVSHLSREPGSQGAGWGGASHALELLAVCLCVLLAGPGRFTLTSLVRRKA